MRQCPLCERLYDDAAEYCPQDGRVLFLPDPLLGNVIDGKYRIDALLGGGGQGTVYRATHVHLQRTSAFKVVRGDFARDESTTERFRREALAVARLKHPHIVTIHDFGISPEAGAYLVLEFLAGHSLGDEIRHSRIMPLGTALELMRQLCGAVHAAHAEGVIHRDIKPDNVFLEALPDGLISAKILDFGVAQLRDTTEPEATDSRPPGESPHFTMAGRIFGTPPYMSPEQCLGEPLDARTDLYSLGCVFYEMITGQPPFLNTGTTDLCLKHVHDDVRAPSMLAAGLPASVDAVILKALAKPREERFQTGDEFRRALDSIRATPDLRFAQYAAGISASLTPSPHAAVHDAAPTVTPRTAPNNLPQPITAFIGREDAIRELERLRESTRLLTLTGPSGCGKTRLSLQVATGALEGHYDGVWLVELASVADRALVPQAVAIALGVAESPQEPLLASLSRFLEPRRTLLVLDNCEHLVSACAALVGKLLRAAPQLRVLATSQEALGIHGEMVWPVPPLSLPDVPSPAADEASGSEAVRLFTNRAFLSNSRFALTDENAPVVVDICRRLDGIPLAIELAAARVKMLTVEQIADRLSDRFRLLTKGDRTATPRQQTLQGAIDWSYDLLGDTERAIFDRLSVFAGGFTLEAAEAVCAGPALGRATGEGERANADASASGSYDDASEVTGLAALALDGDDVLDLLSRLVDKSLVVVEDVAVGNRYRFLQTIRQYAARKLQESGGASPVRSAHRDYYLRFAEEAERDMRGPRQQATLDRLEVEHDNLRAALEWSKTDAASSDAFLRMVGALAEFWQVRGHAREGYGWLAAAIAASDPAPSLARASALRGAGTLAGVLGEYAEAQRHHTAAVEVGRAVGEPSAVARALNGLGFIAQWRGKFERAERLHAESLALAREANDAWEIASALNNLGVVHLYTGRFDSATQFLGESLALFREIGDRRKIGSTLNNLGIAAANQGDYDRSREFFEEHLALQWETGDEWEIASSLNNLGEVAQRQGDYGRARDLLTKSLKLFEGASDKRGVAYSLECFVALATVEKKFERATRLAGAAEALRTAAGSPIPPTEREELGKHLDKAKEALGQESFRTLYAEGLELDHDGAITYALGASA